MRKYRKSSLAGMDTKLFKDIIEGLDCTSYGSECRFMQYYDADHDYKFYEYDPKDVFNSGYDRPHNISLLMAQSVCFEKENNPNFNPEDWDTWLCNIEWDDVDPVAFYYFTQAFDIRTLLKYGINTHGVQMIRPSAILCALDFDRDKIGEVWDLCADAFTRISRNDTYYVPAMLWLRGESVIEDIVMQFPHKLKGIVNINQTNNPKFDEIFFNKFDDKQRESFVFDMYDDASSMRTDDLVERIFAVDLKYISLLKAFTNRGYRSRCSSTLNMLIKAEKDESDRTPGTTKWRYHEDIRKAAALAKSCYEKSMTNEVKHILKEAVPLIKIYGYNWNTLFPVIFPQYA